MAFDREIGSPLDEQLWRCGELARTFKMLRDQAMHIGEFRLTDHRLDDTAEPFVAAKTLANAGSNELLVRRWAVRRDTILDAAEDLAPLVPVDAGARGDLAKWKERFSMIFVSASIFSYSIGFNSFDSPSYFSPLERPISTSATSSVCRSLRGREMSTICSACFVGLTGTSRRSRLTRQHRLAQYRDRSNMTRPKTS
jgi:hypothetical protein